MNQELTVRYIGERIRFSEETAVGTAIITDESANGSNGSPITIKGDFEPDELECGLSYRLFGSFSNYKNRRTGLTEKQFVFKTFVPVQSFDREGIEAYLESIGRGLGLGIGTARKAFDRWGSDAVAVIRKDPRELLHVNRRITDEQLVAIGQKLVERQATEAAMIDIASLLHGRGLPKKTPQKAIKAWGNLASAVIRKDPYRLMNFRGCGFKRCDALYLELGLPHDALRRQALCGWYSIASKTDGDTWFPIEQALTAIRSVGANADPERAIELATRLARLSPDHYGAVHVLHTDGMQGPLCSSAIRAVHDVHDPRATRLGEPRHTRRWVAEGRKARQEHALAEMIVECLTENAPRRLMRYERFEREELSVQDHVRCNRCGRRLTAAEVHVLNGVPFGPTCIEKVVGLIGDQQPVVVPLDDWLRSHPVVKKIVEERPRQLEELPEFSIWPEPENLEITDHQKSELSNALVGRLGILGGSPGTGKTYAIAQVVKALLRGGKLQLQDIAIGAPTGKAAVRITENLQAAGIPMRARTWHSLLGVGESDSETGGFSFRFNRGNPWPYKVIIGDESSMNDTSLACAVFAARPRGCHVLLVGDVNQLPPVGHGAPLRDMIAAGVPYGELTEIIRNSGGIVEACAAIRDGKPWSEGDNLHLIKETQPESQLERLEQIIDRCREHFDPVWDIQVLTAVNLRSKLSRKVVNQHLQALLNSNPAVDGTPFRLADKIVCLKNGYYPLEQTTEGSEVVTDDDGRVYVANGELARVLEIHDKRIIAELSSPDRIIVIPRGKVDEESESNDEDSGAGCNFDLAYALSCHKCVHPETLIESLDGVIPIRNIAESGMIGTPHGPRCFENRVAYIDVPCVELVTKDGNTITVSEEHKCEVWNGVDYQECFANQIRPGDFVRTALFASLEPAGNPLLPVHFGSDSRAEEIIFPQQMSTDLAEFLGLVVGDGCVFRGGIRLGKRHKEVTDRFDHLVFSLFGVQCKRSEKLGMFVAEAFSTALRDWLLNLGGCQPKFKFIPECVMRSRQDIHAAFLRGVFEDGTVGIKNDKADHVEWSSCFPRLLYECRYLLNRLGIICGRNSQKRSSGLLYIYGQEIVKFRSRIGFISQFKNQRLQMPVAANSRYLVPLSPEFIEEHRQILGNSNYQNAKLRGYLSRGVVERIGDPESKQLLRWHHSRIAEVRSIRGPVMCVEVPSCHTFMQNGFPWGNSQGSEWPVVIVLLDDYPGARQICDRSWIYTAISRAKEKCYLVGQKSTADAMCRRNNIVRRKTFLKELIGLEHASKILELI